MYDDKSKKTDTNTAPGATATRCTHEKAADTLARLRVLREPRYGRWAPLVAGYEHLIDTALAIAEDAVADRPARLDQVKRLRLHVQLKLAGITDRPIDLDELGATVRVLARLAETELRIPGLSGGAEALLSLVERASMPRTASDDRDVTFIDLRTRF